MNYWSLSTIATSPACQHPGFLRELADVYATGYLSPAAFETCGYVARHTVPIRAPLVFVESVGCAARQVYLGYPDWRQWSALERGGVFEAGDGMLYVVIDALH